MELTIKQALQQAVAAHKGGSLQEAERIYRAILKDHPKHPDANHNLGVLAVSVNQTESALPFLKTALDINPNVEQFWLSYIDALVKARRLKDAKQAVKKAKKRGFGAKKLQALLSQPQSLNDHKGPSESQLNSLMDHYQNGRFDDAEKLATMLTQEFPSHQFAWKVAGAILGATGRQSEALKANQTAIALHAEDAEAHNNLGNSLQVIGKLDEAEASYNQAIALKSDYADAHYNRGMVLQKLGRLGEAEASYIRSIALNQNYVKAYNNLGITLQEMGKFKEAEDSYNQAIVLNPSYTEAIYNLGVMLFEHKKYALAAEQFALCNTEKGRRFAIKCSFLLDEETTFFDKYDQLVDQGDVNAVLGSMAFRSELKYGRKKRNPFCGDPLKYIVKADLNKLCDFESVFITPATDALDDESVSLKAQGHLKNGVQTAGNIFTQSRIAKTNIERMIRTEVEKYRIQFKDSSEGFIKAWPAQYEIYGWLLRMKSGGKLAPHMHDSGWITGSVYINVPQKSERDDGNLVLCVSDQDDVCNPQTSQQNIVDVVTGTLCLFPSSLHHHTIPFEVNEERIVLAFDIIPKD